MSEYNSSQTLFLTHMKILDRAITLLETKFAGISLAERTSPESVTELKHIQERLALLRAERPERICVLILGEFKAGKSTLINALIGRVVAAVDIFEMTMAVCRIVPCREGAEFAELRDPLQEAPPLRISLTEFLVRSQARDMGKYTQVDLHVHSGLDVVMIDTPGLGATLANEIKAVDALGTTDVVLWTLDADSLGGAREAAVITGIKKSGLPLVCVLTKADVLDDDEVEQAVEYISETFDLPITSIIPVSAVTALENHQEPGIERLRQHLIEQIAPRGAALREQALLANTTDIAAELSGTLDRTKQNLESAMEQIVEYSNAMKSTAESVTEDICSEMSSRIRSGLLDEINNRVDIRLGEGEPGKPLSEADLAAVLKASTQKIEGRQFWDGLLHTVESRIQDEWQEGIRGQITSLIETLNEVRHDADRDASRIAEEMINVQIVEAQRKQSSVAYGLETVTTAVIGTLLSGGNLFIGVLAAAPLFYRWWQVSSENQQSPSSYERRLILQERITEWVNDTVRKIVEQNFYPRLLEVNNRVAEEACNAYAKKQERWPLPLPQLTELLHKCEAIKDGLNEVRKERLPLLTASTD